MSHHPPHTHELPSVPGAVILDPVTDPRWNTFVEGHPFGLICHHSRWKQVLEESFPHMKGYYLALPGHEKDSIRAALPLFEIKSILTGKRLVSIPFATHCDPLISSPEDMRELLDAALALSKTLGISRIELKVSASAPRIHDDRMGIMVSHKSHELSLEADPEELMKTFSKQVKRKIKLFQNTGFALRNAEKNTDIEEFYQLYVKTRKRLGLPPQPYVFFYSLWEKFSYSNNISILLARYKGQLIAGLIMLKFKDRCSWEYLASDASFQNLHTNYFILWEAIKVAHAEGYRIFDFGRTGISNEGLMTFKGLWGTTVVDLPELYYPKKAFSMVSYHEGSVPYKIVREINKKLPDPLFKYIGNFVYRHLG